MCLDRLRGAALDALADECLPRHRNWRRSRNGNLWRRKGRLVLVVFPHGRGPDGRWRFGWCINGPDGARFSPRTFTDSWEAQVAVWEEANREG